MLRSNRPTLPTLFYVLGGLFGFLLLLSSRRLPVELSSQGLGPHLRNFQERAGEQGGRREDGELVWTTEKSLRPHETKEERKDGDLEKEKGSVEAGSHVSHGAAGALSEQGGSAKTDHEKAPREDEDEESAAAAATAIPREENEGGEEKRIKVFMDFQQSRASWGVAHNRALESVLTQHPEAEIVVLVSAPDLYKKYHYADALGRPFFQKYFKRGYNVTIQPVNENTFLAEGMDEDLPGRDWFVREFYNSSLPDSQCPKCNQLLFREFNQALTAVIPMAPLMYIRWAHLWKEGGVYTDFSVLWHRPFPAERYFDMSPPACSPFDVKARENYPSRPEPSVLGPEQVTPVEKRLAFPTPPAGMLGSMHMHFHKHDRVLACAMIEIGTPRFRKCFNESTEYGRDCVQTIMRLCIAHENTQVGGGEEGKEESPPPPSAEGRKDAAMSSLPSSLPPSKHSVREGGVVAWFQCNGSAGDAAPAVERWREDPQVAGSSALWLGRYVRMGLVLSPPSSVRWSDFPPSLDPSLPPSLYARATAESVRLSKWNPAQTCEEGGGREGGKEGVCGHSEFIAGTRNCGPSFFIPGTQKGASSFLFDALTRHPQVLQPTISSQYKEPGVYMHLAKEKRLRYTFRSDIFPFVEAGEPFHSGEATVAYMYQPGSPRMIKKDNPRAKFIFALRDPIARAWSDYRFNFDYFQKKNMTFKEVVERGITDFEDCFSSSPEGQKRRNQSRIDALNRLRAKEEELGVWEGKEVGREDDIPFPDLFSCPCSDPHRIIFKGLYVFSYEYYTTFFPAENLHVVTAEQLRENQTETLTTATSFLGLCPYDWGHEDLSPVHVTKSKAPLTQGEGGLEGEIEERLRAFYSPYNRKLYKLLGRDLGWEK